MTLVGSNLAKLTITAYPDREQIIAPNRDDMMEVMYNPASIQLSYQNRYKTLRGVGINTQNAAHYQSELGGLTLDLILDGTLPGNSRTVNDQLDHLNRICNDPRGEHAEPRFLRITWGRMQWHGRGYFAGRMTSMSVQHTLFDRSGMPLRANVTLSLVADESVVLQNSRRETGTPKKARIQVVGQGSLPLLAAGLGNVLGSSAVDYLSLAQANDLDHLDDQEPGSTLTWEAPRGNE
ncbi:CIS tube protein [Pseudomonas koreensis]|uniref:CIS tube protein n=1 Tax=Pseudomonas koreensis TaxID=198620 RepID=UPI003F85F912